ncbi:helix-turn-helix domain-containing protein [Bacillus sp. ISL-46]|uniref:helix-turn-helix domain-containing protein n=1 Tax=Bacillus sp. ISL-46 TaxID=2819129 RepID=UPI001BEAE698|nr:helix-turn-helix domain-containing protein [Bacillus sp. ISL-46]MBT2722858.1 helix-turn-helix domain-containing protein [Bacillus sp. ISL-46]
MESNVGYTKFHTTINGVEHWAHNVTGEVKYLVNPSEFTITSNQQRDAYLKKIERENAIINGRSKNWVACYHDAIKSLSSRLSLEEMGAVFLLLPYMNLKRKGELTIRGEKMNVTSISKAIGKSVPQTKRLLPKLVETGVLYKEREGRSIVYGVSTEYHRIGKGHTVHFTKLYQQFTLKLQEEYDLTIQLAGLLYAILPYFHYKTFLLCNNPNEQDDKALDPMSECELSELLGTDRSTINRLLNQLSRRGVTTKIGSHSVSIYRVNPDLMYRMDKETEFTVAVRADFQETMKLYQKEKAMKSYSNKK